LLFSGAVFVSEQLAAAVPSTEANSRDTSFLRTLLGLLFDVWRTAIGIAAIFGYLFAAAYAASGINAEHAPGIAIALVFAYLPFLTLVHELGHAAAARLAGWRVHYIMVWGWAWFPVTRKFQRMKLPRGQRVSGLAFATPVSLDGWTTSRDVAFLAGGIAANFLFGGTCLLVFLFPFASSTATMIVGGTGLASLVMGVGNLIPTVRRNGKCNDGASLFYRLIGRLPSDADKATAILQGQLVDGVPAFEWDESLVVLAEPRPITATSIGMLVNRALALGDLAGLLQVLRRAEAADAALLEPFLPDYAFALILAERDVEAAARIFDKLDGAQRCSFSYLRAIACLHALRNDADAALAAVAEARKFATDNGVTPDQDDEAVFAAIAKGEPLPSSFMRAA
jgi:peptidase M50-like protein